MACAKAAYGSGLRNMKVSAFKLATAALLSLSVAACVPTTTTTETKAPDAPALPAAAPPPKAGDPDLYVARSDTNFTVPALPIEQIPETYRRQTVAYETTEVPGTIVIDPSKRLLYFVTGKNTAIRYGIAVGADGFGWSGTSDVTNKRHWPTWTPPKEMIERKPSLAKWEKGQPGGPTNPLGSRAIYLTTNGRDYGYRIHGTPEWKSIGRNASSGCFRMINQDVMDLYERVPMGAKVVVLNADGSYPTKLTVPPPQTPKKAAPKATPKPEVTPAAVVVPAPTALPTDPIPGLTAPSVEALPAATNPAPATTAPALPGVATPEVTAPAAVTPALPAAPVVAAPSVVAPTVTVPALPSVTPAAPTCAVALVNGTCPTP